MGVVMGRAIAAGVAGILVAFVVVAIVELIGHTIWPMTPDPTSKKIDLNAVPVGALLAVLLAWIAGAFAGIITSARIVQANNPWPTRVVIVLFVSACLANAFVVPHPTWFLVAAAVGLIVSVWAGLLIAQRMQTPKVAA
jgi:hypothetical protein